MNEIKFGTSGWRGILAEEFTFPRVRVVVQAIADHLKADGDAQRGVVVGYDCRFFGDRFAREAVQVLASAGVPSFLCRSPAPTPVIAHEIIERQAAGGINFTASHNPGEYNGLKFSPASGGPALPEATADIERRANALLAVGVPGAGSLEGAEGRNLLEWIDPAPSYLNTLRQKVDLASIADAGLKIAVDPMYGAGIGYLDRLLEEAGVEVSKLHVDKDPSFGGNPPDPGEAYLGELIDLVRGDDTLALGLATDGDADRYGIIDTDGRFYEPNYILALLADYLLGRSAEKKGLARSVATSALLDRVAAYHQVELLETPVGFKYIGDYICQGRILIGGEESAGLTVAGHVPDKDGILACLLVAEMVAKTGLTLGQLLTDLYARVGACYTRRDNLRLDAAAEADFGWLLNNLPTAVAGLQVSRVIRIDGTKLMFDDGSWLLFRKSGTEPVVRIYSEAGSPERLDVLAEAGKDLVTGG